MRQGAENSSNPLESSKFPQVPKGHQVPLHQEILKKHPLEIENNSEEKPTESPMILIDLNESLKIPRNLFRTRQNFLLPNFQWILDDLNDSY